jgi:short-subunit dehydrogenase
VTTICPGFVRTELTEDNQFPMPFIIDADQAARSICRGLAQDRTEIVFPAPMAVLAKMARLVPARAWTALWLAADIGADQKRYARATIARLPGRWPGEDSQAAMLAARREMGE